MKNANEMKKITEQVVADRKQAVKTEAISFCESIVADAVEYSANIGERVAIIDVADRINLDYVASYLNKNGYVVKFNMGRQMRVEW